MKWCFSILAASVLSFAGLLAAIDGRSAAKVDGAGTPAVAPEGSTEVSVVEARNAIPEDFEERLEREVIAPLGARRDWAHRARFSRAAVSRERIGFEFSRVEVPERLRPVAAAAFAIEIGGVRRLLPVRERPVSEALEVRVGEAWFPAAEWIADRRSDLALAEACPEPLIHQARPEGGSAAAALEPGIGSPGGPPK